MTKSGIPKQRYYCMSTLSDSIVSTEGNCFRLSMSSIRTSFSRSERRNINSILTSSVPKKVEISTVSQIEPMMLSLVSSQDNGLASYSSIAHLEIVKTFRPRPPKLAI